MAYSHDISLTSPGDAHNINFKEETLIFNLTVHSATHTQISENIKLFYIPDALIFQTAENVTLSSRIPVNVFQTNAAIIIEYHYVFTLSVRDATQAQTSENTLVTQTFYIPLVNDSTQLIDSDNISYFYRIVDAEQLQTSDNVVLNQNYVLMVIDATQKQTSDNIKVKFYQPLGTLTMDDGILLQNSDTIIFFKPLIPYKYRRFSFGIGKKGLGI